MQGYQRRVHGDSANSVLLRKMMKSFIILNILVSVVVVNVGGQSSSPAWTDGECCPTKMVGGKKYRLVGQSDEAWDFGCSSDCTYKTRDSDVKYCFKPGSPNSECFWEEGEGGSRPPMTGSPGNRPPTTPGNRPPTTPGNRPPTTEGNRPPTTEGNRPTTAGGNTGGGSTLPNPGGSARELTLEIDQTWSQEPSGYTRTAKVAIPATSAGEKVPVVFHLHGNGGQGNTRPFGNFLGDDCIIVAPDGYERSWNVYSEKSKADDVQFILDLIAKIGAEIPEADMNNVNIAGTSNGAALTYQILINTGADRPFKRAFPMVSSLIGPQYHDDQLWKFAESGDPNDFSVAMVPTFADDFEYAHFHGTEDGAIKYEGQNPGPGFLKGAEVIAAQITDFVWAKALGFTGGQIPDSDGVQVGTDSEPTQEYKYLDGRCRHYKLIGEGHGTGPSHSIVQQVMIEMILG